MRRSKTILIFSLLVIIACNEGGSGNDSYLDSEHWKREALQQILPSWTHHATDTARGAFFANLDSSWKPIDDTIKFPSMIARHLFSESGAYLLDGDQGDLEMAREIKT